MNELLLTYYGDDFTGSTDALEALSRGGVRTMLFMEPPTPELVEQYLALSQSAGSTLGSQAPLAVGLAGMSRTMSPQEMDEALPAAFEALKQLGAPLCHYKVCSTFDSAPHIGSIGRATEIGRRVFGSPFIPLVVGAPALQRYVLFGNHFATVGDKTVRLDRHPTMSRHPVTPMDESDLRRHLARQTSLKMGLVDVLALNGPEGQAERVLQEAVRDGAEIVLFDTLTEAHEKLIGRLLWEATGVTPLFIVGSSGVEYALAAHWRQLAAGIVTEAAVFDPPSKVRNVLVMSGSASPVTAEQIRWALGNGFVGLRLDVARLVDAATAEEERERVCGQAAAALEAGKSVVLYSALGPNDKAIYAGEDKGAVSRALAKAQGKITRELVQRTDVQRVCVAGGDTCGWVVQELGVRALEMLAPVAPGGPLCRAYRSSEPTAGTLELALKGGQLGQVDYFGRLLGKSES